MSTSNRPTTDRALDLLGHLQRSWLTNMDEIQDRGCYKPGSEEEQLINIKVEASYRVAHVLDDAYDHLLSKAVDRGYVPF
jgi:hypothetical protein